MWCPSLLSGFYMMRASILKSPPSSLWKRLGTKLQINEFFHRTYTLLFFNSAFKNPQVFILCSINPYNLLLLTPRFMLLSPCCFIFLVVFTWFLRTLYYDWMPKIKEIKVQSRCDAIHIYFINDLMPSVHEKVRHS